MKNLAGKRYGRWSVISLSKIKDGKGLRWDCICDCGVKRDVAQRHLINNKTKSCGCLNREKASLRKRTHGESCTTEYYIWSAMLRRCNSAKSNAFIYYGARGITVCDRWLVFENFCADMGKRPSLKHSIDRINNNGNYEPGNCRWATAIEQARNKPGFNVIINFEGKKYVLSELAEKLKISRSCLEKRIKAGWNIERIITEPVNSHYQRKKHV